MGCHLRLWRTLVLGCAPPTPALRRGIVYRVRRSGPGYVGFPAVRGVGESRGGRAGTETESVNVMLIHMH